MVEDVEIPELSYSKKQLLQASMRLATLKNQYYMGDENKSPDNIEFDDLNVAMVMLSPDLLISDCQVSVELAAKSIFKTLGINPPPCHDIELSNERVQGLLSRIPKEFENGEKIPRVIFLTQFWERFYTLAKYGEPKINLSSKDIVNIDDAQRAVQDAEYCLNVSTELHNYMLDNKEVELSDLNLAMPERTIKKFGEP